MKTLDIEKLVNLVAEGVRVLRSRDGVPLTDDQITERARGICTIVITNYEMRELPELGLHMTIDFDDPAISGKPVAHTWSCKCDKCDTYNRSVQK